MFIGHFGVGLAAKRAAPRTSLGTLFFAAELLDLLWPLFLLLGLEHVRITPGITAVSPFDFYDYPVSHSLLTVLLWSSAAGTIYFLREKYRRGAWVVAAGVLSHWVLDAIVHRPDLPLAPGAHVYIGLGLWNSWTASIGVELTFFLGGLVLYLRTTRPKDGVGRYGLWSLLGVLFLGWVGSLLAGPPPSSTALAWGALAMWLTVPAASWVDAHRQSV